MNGYVERIGATGLFSHLANPQPMPISIAANISSAGLKSSSIARFTIILSLPSAFPKVQYRTCRKLVPSTKRRVKSCRTRCRRQRQGRALSVTPPEVVDGARLVLQKPPDTQLVGHRLRLAHGSSPVRHIPAIKSITARSTSRWHSLESSPRSC